MAGDTEDSLIAAEKEQTDGAHKVKGKGFFKSALLFCLLGAGAVAGWYAFQQKDKPVGSLPQATIQQSTPVASNGAGQAIGQNAVQAGGQSTAVTQPVPPQAPVPSVPDKQLEEKAVSSAETAANGSSAIQPESVMQNASEQGKAAIAQEGGTLGNKPVTGGTGSNRVRVPPVTPGVAQDSPAKAYRAASPERTAPVILKSGGEDAVVRFAFVKDLAAFLAANYWPAHTWPDHDNQTGATFLSIKNLNGRYGSALHGLAAPGRFALDNKGVERSRILIYVLPPSMLEGLERLYSGHFIQALRQEAERQTRIEKGVSRPLSVTEQAEMFAIYADEARKLAAALRAYAQNPDAYSIVSVYQTMAGQAQAANKAYLEAKAGIDVGFGAQVPDVEARLARSYQAAVSNREQARSVVIALMSRNSARRMEAENLLYVAGWAKRRGPSAGPSLSACAAVLETVAGKLESAGKDILK